MASRPPRKERDSELQRYGPFPNLGKGSQAHSSMVSSTKAFSCRSSSLQYLKAASCVLSSTTWGAAPLSKASCQRLAQRHQKSPGLRPGKPYCGAGLERSFPLDLVNSRKAWRQHGQVEDREKERIGVSRGIAGKSRVDRGIESLPRAVSSQIFRIRSQPLVSVGSGRSPASSLSTRRAFRSRSHPSCSTHRGRNLSSVPRALSTSEALCQARSASAPHFPCRRRPLRRLSAKVGRRRGMRPPIRAPGGPTRRRRREHRQRELSCACTFQARARSCFSCDHIYLIHISQVAPSQRKE